MTARKLREEIVRRRISVVEKTFLWVCVRGGVPHSGALEQVAQRGCAVSARGVFQDQTESSPEQLSLT